jgi:hypothetical protein
MGTMWKTRVLMLIWLNDWLHNCYTTRSSNGIFLDRLQDGYSLPFMGCTSKWLNVVPRLISKDLVDLVDLSNHHAAWINPPSLMLKSQCSDGYKMLQTHLSQLIGYCWIQYLCFFGLFYVPVFPLWLADAQLHSVKRAWTILILTFFVARKPGAK